MMTDYESFRQRLDHVLRTLDVEQVRNFLIAENQWSAGMPANPEFAMWMMIAGSATLSDLHGRAYEWLMSHGYESEAQAVLGRRNKQTSPSGKGGQRTHRVKDEKSREKLQARNVKKQGNVRHDGTK